jgi:FkbM family methyltransferase
MAAKLDLPKILRKLPPPIRRLLRKKANFLLGKLRQIIESFLLSEFPVELKPTRRSLNTHIVFSIRNIANRYQLDINSVCHVGAHKGQEITEYLDMGVSSAIFFEPVPENFRILDQVVSKIPNFEAIRIAVGNFDGQINLNLASNDYQSSSVLKPHLHLREAPQVQFNKVMKVRISTLDRILKGIKAWDLLVIDVQGFELRVLEGAIDTLKSSKYILIEVNRAETYRDCAQVNEIDAFLKRHGYRRVLTRWWSSWGDAFYVRENLLPIRPDRSMT